MLLRQSEVEQNYRISKSTLHRWIREGKLTDRRTVGGHRRYDSAEIERLLSGVVSGNKRDGADVNSQIS
ncbi:MAG: helix-turn-helix domain-containing protein [Roseiflexus sp.]